MTGLLFESSYFCMTLTLLAYAAGCAIQKKGKLSLFNPILIGAVLVILALQLLEIPNSVYQEGCKVLSYLLTPATICLAISFYEQFQNLKQHLAAVILGVLAGAISCLGAVYLLSRGFQLDQTLTISLLPKSITTAIGVPISQELGGIAAITTAAIIFTGIFGNVFGTQLCKLFGIRNEIAQGVAFGTASHVIGTSRAVELGQLAGAVSSLSLTVCGLLTALLLSFFAQFL